MGRQLPFPVTRLSDPTHVSPLNTAVKTILDSRCQWAHHIGFEGQSIVSDLDDLLVNVNFDTKVVICAFCEAIVVRVLLKNR
jgi:hypothetical protein